MRDIELKEFEKQIGKEIIEWSRLPEHVQQIRAGDYHYNDWDMEPREKED